MISLEIKKKSYDIDIIRINIITLYVYNILSMIVDENI